MFSLDNRIALVTGGGSGIGLAISRRLIAAGAEVIILDRSDASSTAADIGATFFRLDVAVESSVEQACEATAARFGRIDILVNNAGIFAEGTTAQASTEDWLKSFQVNTLGVVYGIKHAARHMPRGGSIINTSSLAALTGSPGYGPYAGPKAATALLTKVAALEYGPSGIRVNCICPSSVDTPMLASQENAADEAGFMTVASPIRRLIQPEEIAALVHFLASSDCSALTGAVIPIDGGLSAGFTTSLIDAAVSSLDPSS